MRSKHITAPTALSSFFIHHVRSAVTCAPRITERVHQKHMKRILAFALGAIFCLTLLPVLSGCAAPYTQGLEFTPFSSDPTACSVSGRGTAEGGVLRIPPTSPGGMRVVAVEPFAFLNDGEITEVILPDSVHTVGTYAFAGCEKLTEVSFGEELLDVEDFAFEGCSSLVRFTSFGRTKDLTLSFPIAEGQTLEIKRNLLLFPAKTRHVGDGAFAGCEKLEGVLVLTDGVEYVGSMAFAGTKLPFAYVYPTVTTLGEDVFFEVEELLLGTSLTAPPKGWSDRFHAVGSSAVGEVLWDTSFQSFVQTLAKRIGLFG